MKFRLLYIGVIAVASACLTSCSDWFDVSPKTDVKAEELFETPEGFESALAGIYISLTDEDSYGHDMSFGLIDQLAQLYDRIPDGTTDREAIYQYEQQSDGYYTKSRLAAIWLKSYNLIANANNLIKWLDKNGTRVLDEQTRNLYYGEAYALRAYLHFDLLRGWGPMNYQTGKSTLTIPYREVANSEKLPRLSAETIVQKIEADLEKAEQYLVADKATNLADNERRNRMNYYAVKALEARVACYAGEADKAIASAEEVINHSGLALQTSNTNDPAQYTETLFGINKYQMSDNISSYFAEGPSFTTQYWTSLANYKRIFEAEGNERDADIRARRGAGVYVYDGVSRVISRKYLKNDDGIIPLVRLPEMYYILCEMSPLADAPRYINIVRSRRGISNSSAYTSFANEDARTEALSKEYRKEFYAEGQYFYFLKRHGITSLDYSHDVNTDDVVSMSENRYVFPLPDGEKEYGWTDEESNNTSNN